MTGFNTQVGGGEYRLQFETDNREHYELMQKTARQCVGTGKPLTNADRICSMSDEELAKAIRIHVGSSEDVACCYCHGDKGCINADGGINCDDKTEETCIVAWLRQPVTQPNPGADDNHDHSGLLEE